jgi:hypothetical protein
MNQINVPNIATPYGLKRLRAGRAQWKANPAYDEQSNFRYIALMFITIVIAIGTLIKYLIFDSGAF